LLLRHCAYKHKRKLQATARRKCATKNNANACLRLTDIMCVRVCVCVRAHTHAHTHTHTHTRTHTSNENLSLSLSLLLSLTHSLTHTHTHTDSHTATHTYLHTHTHRRYAHAGHDDRTTSQSVFFLHLHHAHDLILALLVFAKKKKLLYVQYNFIFCKHNNFYIQFL